MSSADPVTRRVFLLAVAVMGVVFVCLAGWATGRLGLAGFGSTYIAMAPSTAMGFFLLALGATAVAARAPEAWRKQALALLLTGLSMLLALAALRAFFADDVPFIEQVFTPPRGAPGAIPLGRMSPVAASLFCATGAAQLVVVSAIRRRSRRLYAAAGALATLGAFGGLILVVGYWYRVPMFYGGAVIPPAFPTALCFVLVNLAIFSLAAPFLGIVTALAAETPNAQIVRGILPAVVACVLLQGWVESAGLLAGLNSAVKQVVLSLVFSAIIGGVVLVRSRSIALRIRGAEEAVERTARLLAETGAMAKVGGWELDLRSSKLTWTDQVRIIHEVDPEFSPTVDKAIDFYSPESRPVISEAMLRAVEHGAPFDVSLQLITAKGNRRWVQALGHAQCNHGKPVKVFGSFQDITEKKEAEDAIAEEKERLAVTLRSIGDGVITTDIGGKITVLNRAAEAMTGFQSSEARGRPLAEVFHILDENTRQVRESPVAEVIRSGQLVELANHTLLCSRDGRERLIADSAAPIRDRNSAIIGVVLVFRDTTDKERSEAQLRNLQRLQSLGVLAGGIAHDFNNILTAIFGNLELARMTPERLTANKYLAEAAAAIDRAKGLSRQLLTFAKGGAPVRKAGDLFPLVNDTVLFSLRGSNVSYRLDVPDGLWSCCFDAGQIGQAVENVVINAVQAMPDGGVLTVSARNAPLGEGDVAGLPAGNYVELSFRDEGPGMPANVAARIFEPYFTTKETGTGLGLAMVHSIVQRHDGGVRVDATPGQGAVFHVYLPASDRTTDALDVADDGHRGAGRILVMDDEEPILRVMTQMLEELGYSVATARDGQEALDVFAKARETEPFSALILDLTIRGGLGGKETARTIRASDPAIPIFVASGYSADPVMAEFERWGFTDRLDKPFRLSELRRLLDKHLRAER